MKRGAKPNTNIFTTIGYIAVCLSIAILSYITVKSVVFFVFSSSKTSTAQATHPTPTPSGVWCDRKTPYPMQPEFQRALSIIVERVMQSEKNSGTNISSDPKKTFYNCLDIQYADLSQQQAEGEFLFDVNSSPEDLRILVDNSYQEYDDYLTAILLSHEVTHAYQFLEQHFENKYLSCYDKEITAFETERDLFADFNQEEQASLIAKVEYNPNKNSAYGGLNALFQINVEAASECGLSASTCYFNSIDRQITQMVESNPFYQQECASQ